MAGPGQDNDDQHLTRSNLLGSTALQTIFTVKTPILPDPVSLLKSTWEEHIIRRHPEMAGKESHVMAATSTPTFIVPGTTNPDYLIFVDHENLSQKGNPLIAVINPEINIVVTSLYHRSYRIISAGSVLWPL